MLGPGQWQVKPARSVCLYDAGQRQVHFCAPRNPGSRLKKGLWRMSLDLSKPFLAPGVDVLFIKRCFKTLQSQNLL